MARQNIIQQWLGLNMDEDEQKYRMGMMENAPKATSEIVVVIVHP